MNVTADVDRHASLSARPSGLPAAAFRLLRIRHALSLDLLCLMAPGADVARFTLHSLLFPLPGEPALLRG
jgi:hypothetical protein